MRSHGLTVLGGALLLSLGIFCASGDSIVIAADSAGADIMPICTLPKCLNLRVTTKSGIGTANATAEAKIHPEDAAKWCATHKPKDKLCVQEQVRSGWVGFKGLYRANADCVAGRMTAIDGNQYTYAGVWEDGPGKGRPKFTTTNRRFPHTKWDETGVDMDPTGIVTGWGGGSPNLAAQWEVLCAGAPAPAAKVSQPPAQAPQSAPSVPNAVQIRQSELQQFAAETQLQSADFGTPEATAKIAAKAGFIDVVGVKLGMPLKAAIYTLKAHNPNLTMDPMTIPPYEALPGVVMTPVLQAPNPGGPNATSGDDFHLLLTYVPNEAFVWGIVRNMGFGRVDERPTVENTLAGLRQKYGQESVKEGDSRLIWIYDGEGKQVMGQQAKDIRMQCSSTWVSTGGSIAGNNPDRNNQYSNSYFDQQLKGGYYYGAGRMGSPGGVCHTHSALDVNYIHATPAGSAADLMMGMVIGLFNHQLEASGVTASHTNLMAAVGRLNEKRGEEENKRGGMEF